ncbi:glycosyltransferase [Hydrocoleum sp. CS-953]|uniref:glycosyltransferase n=1 Tax=Hydrocoleum sp. CS-953 TaxID=1671698 RepID=UPI001AEFF4A7|nr:glycosyltransferase [Hydrocoleum sp. CS-953]
MEKLQDLGTGKTNINIQRYTPHLLNYMENSELSISMSGYNTTMNILMTGVRAMMMAFTGNGDQEQTMRVRKLEQMGIVKITHPEDLVPEKFPEQIINYLQYEATVSKFDFNDVEKTAFYLESLCQKIESVV